MFDWFWSFLYGITKGILRLIDGLMTCANKLCGIEPINVGGEETDFMSLLFFSNEITFAFRVAVILGTIVIVFFTIFAMIRCITNEKVQDTPTQVCFKTFKSIILFLFVPAIMVATTWILNVFMAALYKGTSAGGVTIGQFLFSAFADGAYNTGYSSADALAEGFNYADTDAVWAICDLSDFSYIFSWIAGIAILIFVAIAMISFIDRAISIVILYIAAPFSIASSVIDDGARFKLWRDQILVKFINGYGMILAINIYCLVISLVIKEDVVFFDNWFTNNIMKVTIILGGAFGMQRLMAVIGNLISAGAGTNEARENMMTAAATGHALTAPFRASRGAFNFARDAKNYGFGSALGGALGFRTAKDYMQYNKNKKALDDEKKNESSGAGNNNKTNYNDEDKKKSTSNAILGNSVNQSNNNNTQSNNSSGSSGNGNHNKPNGPGQNMIEMAMINNNDVK